MTGFYLINVLIVGRQIGEWGKGECHYHNFELQHTPAMSEVCGVVLCSVGMDPGQT